MKNDEFKKIEDSFQRIKEQYYNGHYDEFPPNGTIKLSQELAIDVLLEDQEKLIETVKILNEINEGLVESLDLREFSFKQYMVALQDNQRYKKTLELILEQTEYDSSYIGMSIFTDVTKTLRGEIK